MEIRFKEIADKITKFTTKKSSVAFLDDRGNFLYSSLTKESEEAVKKISGVFSVWNVGDYLIKKLLKSNILIYKVSPHIIVALDSYEKEGVLIIVGKRLEENSETLFKDLESMVSTAPVKEIEASSKEEMPRLTQATAQITETRVAETVQTSISSQKIEEETRETLSTVPSSSGETEETVTVSFPILVDTKALKKARDPMTLSILNLCDGGHTIDDIAEELKIPKVRVMIITGEYSAKGVLKYISGIRKVKK
ncbi:MAG: hypothetical protein QXO71_03160 [Candidatus Jordarchaeaceae archaeon]